MGLPRYLFFMPDEKVLITGGTGFIGSFLAKNLIEEGCEVTLYDISPSSKFLEKLEIQDQVNVRRGDVTSLKDTIKTVQEIGSNRIIHLAALLTDGIENDPRLGTKVNILGFNNILEAADIIEDVQRIVWTSSTTVYASSNHYTEPVNENDLVYPETLYGGTKIYNEIMAKEYADSNFTTVGIRPSLTYGPYRKTGGSTILTDIIQKAALGQSYSVGYGDQIVNWHYIKDVVQALRKATFVPSDNLSQGTYNTGGEAATVRDLADTVTDIIPDAEIDVSDQGELPWMQEIDMTSARNDLDYNPKYDLRAGVEEYIRVIRQDNNLPPV